MMAGMATSVAHAQTSPPSTPSRDPILELNSSVGESAVATARATTRDVGGRLARKRAGIPRGVERSETMASQPGAKGGMAKQPIVTEHPRCWEVYGGVFYYTEDYDQQVAVFQPPNTAAPFPIVTRGNADLDIFGGHVGFEHRPNDTWSFGFAIAGSRGDLDAGLSGTADTDTLSFLPYVSYYRSNIWGSADFWADLLYAYSDQEHDITRFTGPGFVTGSPDGEAHTLDFNVGLNYGSETFVHGPIAGLRWIDATVDSYAEIGLGGIFIPAQDRESLASTLGYQASWLVRRGSALWVPQLKVAWEHEFEDDANNLFGFPVAEPDEDLAVVGAGIGCYYDSGWNWLLDYEARLGSEAEGHYVGFKVGKEF